MGRKTAKPSTSTDQGNGETTAGYFRRIFQANPKWLKGRSNEEVLKQWMDDHPGHTSIPDNVKASLSNIKSVLRSKKRKRRARTEAEGQPAQPLAVSKKPHRSRGLLELEEKIDDCLTEARQLDREGLESVINHLRHARNEVVWKMGQ